MTTNPPKTTNSPKLRACVYIDGFNLYYTALKGTNFKWLNVLSMAQSLFPEYDVCQVKYFTARVSPRNGDQSPVLRQQVYLRALATAPTVEIIFGNFLKSVVTMASHPITNPVTLVKVVKTEEKGSDVNIATHMIVDSAAYAYDVILLFSNDSDLKLPVQLARERYQRTVFIVTRTSTPNVSLIRASQNHHQLRKHHLRDNLFPQTMSDARGTFTCPTAWV